MDSIGERIRMLRKDKNVTQEDLGKMLGVQLAAISKYETGRVIPDEKTIKLICAEFHCMYKWLTTGEGPMYETTGDSLIDKYAPDAADHLKDVFRELSQMPPDAWAALRDFMNYIVSAVDQARSDQSKEP